jgi:hypothetical protein
MLFVLIIYSGSTTCKKLDNLFGFVQSGFFGSQESKTNNVIATNIFFQHSPLIHFISFNASQALSSKLLQAFLNQ